MGRIGESAYFRTVVAKLVPSLRQCSKALIGLVYTSGCPGCGTVAAGNPDGTFCADCESAIRRIDDNRCRKCSSPLSRPVEEYDKDPVRCFNCRSRTLYFTAATAWAVYAGPAKNMVLRAKAGKDQAVALALGRLVAEAVLASDYSEKVDCVVAVPADAATVSYRGFNQSELMAAAVSRGLGVSHIPGALRKTRTTAKQAELPAAARFPNVKNAFAVEKPRLLKDKRVVLVDDVMTTCATAAECSRVLLEGGASKVYAAVAARSSV